MTDRGRALALTDIARLAGVGTSAASNWRKRHADFPRPTVASGQELFAADEIARWLGDRKIARNSLQPEESPGTTYGDRFILNGGLPTRNAQADPSQAGGELGTASTNQVWQILHLLRSDLGLASAADFIMAMLYLRATHPELWLAITEQRSWAAVNQMMTGEPPFERDIPLFATAVSDASSSERLLRAVKLFGEMDLDRAGSASMFSVLLEQAEGELGLHGGHFTPPAVARCLIQVLSLQSGDSVYDPSCGSGGLLVSAAQAGVNSVSGQAMNGRSLRTALLNLSIHGSAADVRTGSATILRGAFAGDQFDVVLSNPPFNIALPDDAERDAWPFGVPTRRGSSLAWLQIAVHSLKPGGRAGVLMPNGMLFADGLNGDIRRRMIDAGVVEGVIAFPAGLFATTGIPVSLWLMRRPATGESGRAELFFIDAASMGVTDERARRVLRDEEVTRIVQEYCSWRDFSRSGRGDGSPGFARSVGIDEVRRNGYDLQPRRYVGEIASAVSTPADTPSRRVESLQRELDEQAEQARQARNEINEHFAALRDSDTGTWHEAALGDLSDIQAGPGTANRQRGRTVDDWTTLVLPRNIKRGYISHDELDTVSPEIAAKLAIYSIRPGDIVCTRAGTLGRHGLVREAERGWLLGPSCMRIRPGNDQILPEYLVHYLNSPEVHLWITSQARVSTAIPHISTGTLRELRVPIPPVAMQRDIAATMDLISSHSEHHRRAASASQSLLALVFPMLRQQ